jgi:hypothetical protein
MNSQFQFGAIEVERAVGMQTTGRARILERLASARDEVLSHVSSEHIPESLRQRFDQIMNQLAAIDSLDEDDGMILATALEDLSALLDDEVFGE